MGQNSYFGRRGFFFHVPKKGRLLKNRTHSAYSFKEDSGMTPQIGETAGKVWHLLSDEGPQTLAQLKKKLNGTGDVVSLALGWLAREDKVEIQLDKKNYWISLKQ